MSTKRSRSTTNLSTNPTTVISDLWTSRMFVAPNDYSPTAIGIHSCLVRCCEYEHFPRCFYQGGIIGLQTKDFIHRLNELEKKFKKDSQSDIERCAMVARLRRYLENNEKVFQDILKKIEDHLHECMREDPLLAFPRTYDEFIQQCIQRNQDALEYDKVGRMRRFQFHDQNEIKQPVNLINLQTRTLTHFQLLVDNIKPDSFNREQLLTDLKDLLNNSFFITQHPSPTIATHSAIKNENVTAKINCRLLCLLNRSNPAITIEDITPFVCCLSESNQIDANDVSFRQPQMDWKTYSIVTTSYNRKTFSCADLIEILLNQMSVVPQSQQPPTGKIHYAPFVYRIDFHINVLVHFPNDPLPYQHSIIVQSAPFGLITNTSQEEDLFPKVFLEDLKSWKSKSTMISNITTSTTTTMNLTIQDIGDSIKRYFIHKTGIQPKHWVMPYIRQQLSAVCNNNQNSMDNRFYNILAKILAQIDYMAKHPLLILFHDDGLFIGIYDSWTINQILQKQYEHCKTPVCAMRFGSIENMSDTKDINIRVDLIDKSSNVQRCTFDNDKLPSELASFIIKIALCEASSFEDILSNITEYSQEQFQFEWKNMHEFVDLYDSKKLRELCPHETKYSSIWISYDSKENKKAKDSGLSPIPSPSQNFTMTTTTGARANNNPNYLYNQNICTINQTQQVIQPTQLQYPQQPQYSQPLQPQPQCHLQSQMPLQVQPSYASFSNVQQPSYTPQNNQQIINSVPIVIVITSGNQFTMSHETIVQFISYHLPQYSSFIQSDHIHQFTLDPLSQPFNAPVQTLQNSFPNLQ